MARTIDRNTHQANIRASDHSARLSRRLVHHQALHDPQCEPRNRLRWLKPLQAWQTQRLERSFARFLQDPARRPAASFFLSDVYGDRDFSQRDADIAKVMPMMQRLLPSALVATVTDGIELGVLTHALDLRMAQVLQNLAPRRRKIDEALYAQAYREAGLRRLRARQIALIDHVGQGLASALRMPGVSMLLRLSRVPARAAGLGELQLFLERGFEAFAGLDDAQGFLADIRQHESAAMARLFAGEADPFRLD
ncbi:MAG: FFLEELY motif protein [Thermomonas sp.]